MTPKHLPDPSFTGRTDAAFRDSKERRFSLIRFLTPEPEFVFTIIIPPSGTEGPTEPLPGRCWSTTGPREPPQGSG